MVLSAPNLDKERLNAIFLAMYNKLSEDDREVRVKAHVSWPELSGGDSGGVENKLVGSLVELSKGFETCYV